MNRVFLSAAIAAFCFSIASVATAQEGPPPQDGQRFDEGFQPPMGPGFAVVNDLEQLRRLYAMAGRDDDIIAVYHDVLNSTQDPMLRHYVYDSLAREQLKPSNPDQAISTLRTSLSEDLVLANKAPRPDHANPRAPAQ